MPINRGGCGRGEVMAVMIDKIWPATGPKETKSLSGVVTLSVAIGGSLKITASTRVSCLGGQP